MDIEFIRQNRSGIYLSRSLTERGRLWLRDQVYHEPWQKAEEGIIIDHRMVFNIIAAARDAGLEVREDRWVPA